MLDLVCVALYPSWLENLCRLLFFLIIIKAAGRGPLIPIRNAHNIYPANGNPPVEFPASVLDLNSMTIARLTAILQFYNQPVGHGNLADKRQRVVDFIRRL